MGKIVNTVRREGGLAKVEAVFACVRVRLSAVCLSVLSVCLSLWSVCLSLWSVCLSVRSVLSSVLVSGSGLYRFLGGFLEVMVVG